MRAALGRLNARFPAPTSRGVRDQLARLSVQLASYPDARLSERDLSALEDMLQRHEDGSFYARAPLEVALNRAPAAD